MKIYTFQGMELRSHYQPKKLEVKCDDKPRIVRINIEDGKIDHDHLLEVERENAQANNFD